MAASRNGECLSTEYINIRTKLKWRCESGHIWQATLGNVKNHNRWCPECPIGKNQKQLYNVIQSIYKEHKVYNNFKDFSWLGCGRNKQELDIYVEGLRLAIEYDGEQHFKPVRFGGISIAEAKKKHEYVKMLDVRKDNKIALNTKDIRYFVRFNYKDELNREDIIKKLQSCGVPL